MGSKAVGRTTQYATALKHSPLSKVHRLHPAVLSTSYRWLRAVAETEPPYYVWVISSNRGSIITKRQTIHALQGKQLSFLTNQQISSAGN
ncbi:hypothetical protein [Nitrosomonas sp. Is37]|uniref:hypothetical protein n=1 Tax=Nitrosomonas sp. Is37 TaxID=3080535 RepID=UPI00294A9E69|nr:hypothetical protein [Nitrosomonas sp. Is37]MDV6344940.1 hypothetical protein [Nitrosomonas sp. Is37]